MTVPVIVGEGFAHEPCPVLTRSLLELARRRKKAGRHVLGSSKTLVLSEPVPEQVPFEVVASMLDQARLAKRKGHHSLSADKKKLLLSSTSSSCSTVSPPSSASSCYHSCGSVI